ncbi:MAG: hypothetical protein A3C46_01255 [Deltaproteobacteria bacterium RIFCSPHIGHO2_02_FULL_44_16]|nr:MAG: hypothetical protein A3C46_01255 [Deltaproteobacteria bacterium RIFCSPHIGHO2_02_FULL_44_16]
MDYYNSWHKQSLILLQALLSGDRVVSRVRVQTTPSSHASLHEAMFSTLDVPKTEKQGRCRQDQNQFQSLSV